MSSSLEITTGARLHFGLLSYRPSPGRHAFGGAGLMIDSPRFRIAAEVVDNASAHASCTETESLDSSGVSKRDRSLLCLRAEEFADRYRENCPRHRTFPAVHFKMNEAIPPHVGLGSGTQLAMVVARALALLTGDDELDDVKLAARVGRGARSAVGIHGFSNGGFLVDGGKSDDRSTGSLAARAEFPADWRLVLVTPVAETGLSGNAELEAFAQLPPISQSVSDRLYRLLLKKLLPALLEADFAACGEAIFEFGRSVGECFAPVQGGTYASPAMRQLVKHLRHQGIRGVGQTSWGPTIFTLCPDQKLAEELVAELSTDSRWSECRFHVAAPMNTGAAIQTNTKM
jgi:beta-RFAP synthase